MFKRLTKAEKEIKEKKSSLRVYLSRLGRGRRILLQDNITGVFIKFEGNEFKGEFMLLEVDGQEKQIHIDQFKATITSKLNVKCPACQSTYI